MFNRGGETTCCNKFKFKFSLFVKYNQTGYNPIEMYVVELFKLDKKIQVE